MLMSGRIIPIFFKEVAGISRNRATTRFLAFYDWTQSCHGTGGVAFN